MTPHRVTRPKFAEIAGVSVSTVDRWIAEGMPSVSYSRGMRRILLEPALEWIDQQSQPPTEVKRPTLGYLDNEAGRDAWRKS